MNEEKPEKIYPKVEIKNPTKPWSSCSGNDCEHPYHIPSKIFIQKAHAMINHTQKNCRIHKLYDTDIEYINAESLKELRRIWIKWKESALPELTESQGNEEDYLTSTWQAIDNLAKKMGWDK